ncbi:two-component sensor histidine kinase [Acuticoccus sediminis]|uniref:histidine kinase n=1 Tax=Acuticoccus sediminis TaxID=2184697 RepID=A0A8B2NSV7_9HYPH|nr:ActS/PrrB/RegB family redox-sensitive histidine kinase [Acuticoccus sediminis]RAI03307.1 two-component sensor histidine kinase [Acuticoccus sediminis]
MTEGTAVLSVRERVVRVRTLLLLRWLAILGQLTAILFVGVFLDFDMPLSACLGLVALSAWSNVFLRVKFADNRQMSESWTAGVMAFDIAQLALQLGLTGGLTNPFALLLIAPVMVSATTLSASRTMTLGAFVLLSATMLVVAHEPLPWYSGEHYSPPFLFIGGIWLSLVCSLIFMGSYAFRVSEENRQLADALGATEVILQREMNLHALDGLAAAAAHELGTPLATILVVSKEMERELPPDSPLAEDVALLRSQTERCREILGRLKNLGDDSDSPLVRLNVRTLIEEVAEPHRGAGVEIQVELNGDLSDQPLVARNPAIHYGLGNLVENAVDFAETLVRITATWTSERLTIVIADDGPGFADDVLDRIGDPYVSRRREDQRGGGMGLGIFIAKTLLERTGATVKFEARDGATVTVAWPRRTLWPTLPSGH